MMSSSQNNSNIAELVDSLHGLIEARQAPAGVAIAGLISTAGEIALGMAVARPERKDAYMKAFNSAAEQARRQLRKELKARGL
ncbi:hypothetical protein [Nitrososphaera viennensis]|uniref:Uncharacterized protein n=2 Tax=Nitrososphaera viennensis TaxID=1034015 RepID=A0A060HV01_9ARCH|nr:hypothetical protein [Nitrososphaera viennensis]AIC16882.1 hypothetical protein NVIE_026110 [Nitrososphaera viennensis EN76]UVS68785.1 hypothetical protein NWT39_12870 [Nitrososphaera viennensis]